MVTYQYSGGLLVSAIVLAVLVALPVKLAAHFSDAKRTGVLWCLAAVAVGLFIGCLTALFLGGLVGGPLAGFLGFVLGIRLILRTSFAAAVGLSVIAFVLSMIGFVLLVKLGIITTAATASGVAT
jgi:hypothetical protein